MSKKLCIDLCAGLGGFSRAFKEREDWEVITVDINPKFNTTMVLDLIDVVEHPEDHGDFWGLKPDVIVASPPCERFSIASATWPLPGIYNAMRVAGAVMEIITRMQPEGWIIENPRGRLRYFIGKPHATYNLNRLGYRTVKPTDFWTNLDIGIFPDKKPLNKIQGRKRGRSFAFDLERSPAKRAEMPYGLSRLVLESFEETEAVR